MGLLPVLAVLLDVVLLVQVSVHDDEVDLFLQFLHFAREFKRAISICYFDWCLLTPITCLGDARTDLFLLGLNLWRQYSIICPPPV